MPRVSAGLLMYRLAESEPEVFLVHPGGPFWRNRDAGAWSIPKGEVQPGEELLATAQREFQEETGIVPAGPYVPLGQIKQPGGKIVHAWAFQGNADPASVNSNTFTLEWPPNSGRLQAFPEVDRAQFFALPEARTKMNPAQAAFLDALTQAIKQ